MDIVKNFFTATTDSAELEASRLEVFNFSHLMTMAKNLACMLFRVEHIVLYTNTRQDQKKRCL